MVSTLAKKAAIVISLSLSGYAGNIFASQILGLTDENRISDSYIVVLKSGHKPAEFKNKLMDRAGGAVLRTYKHALSGFLVKASEEEIQRWSDESSVAFIEANKKVSINMTQSNPPWGLDRIDSRGGRDRKYTYNASGRNVHAYVVDTGVWTSHNDFSDRVGNGFSAIDDGNGVRDCNGHGTHVAGTIGGTKYGVAKDVIIHPVRVLNCQGSGTNAGVLDGIDWVAKNAKFPAVANMSLGGGKSTAIDKAVRNAIKTGVTFVVAAGNDNKDACGYSPANVGEAITVGSTTSSDGRSSFSNYGKCVDVFAPGSDILSTWKGSDSATKTISGTSMASPHVAGVVALYLELAPNASPSSIFKSILSNATKDTISRVGTGSPNLFVYTNPDDEDTDPDPNPNPNNPCGDDCNLYTGALSSSTTSVIEPDNGYFSISSSSYLKGYLQVPNGADFKLELQYYRGFFYGWRTVESSDSGSDLEVVEYNATSQGDYRWVIRRNSGSGNYSLWINTP